MRYKYIQHGFKKEIERYKLVLGIYRSKNWNRVSVPHLQINSLIGGVCYNNILLGLDDLLQGRYKGTLGLVLLIYSRTVWGTNGWDIYVKL